MDRRTVLITGASRGIGAAIAEEFARAGYNLTITCISNTNRLASLAEHLSSECGIECNTYVGDLSKSENVTELFKIAGSPDILINNAGISYVGLITDMTFEEWDNIISTNLSSAFYCSKLAIPGMIKRKSGKILNISSVWGIHGASTEVAYSASKGGLNSFTKALAKELAPSNIQVNAIACGLIDTDMNKCFSSEDLDMVISEIPADRIGLPAEVASLALQLCTNNTYLTGQIISLDGGWS